MICLALVMTGCGELKDLPTAPPDPDPIDPTATLSRIQSQIFTPGCAVAGCHDTLGQQEGLILTAGQSFSNLVNRPSRQIPGINRVTPLDPANSYLYRKVTGQNIVNEVMPQGGSRLSEDQIKLIRDWIRRGAPND